MSGAWLVFVQDGVRRALAAAEVERVVAAPALVRLPAADGAAGGWALHLGNALLPMVGGGGGPALALVVLHAGGRFAVGVDAVLGFGPLDDDGAWAGQPVTCLSGDALVPPQPRAEAATAMEAGAAAKAALGGEAEEPAPKPERWLLVQTGGSAWTVAAAQVESIHGPAPCVAVPFRPPGVVGVVVLRGVAVPVVSPPLRARAGTGQAGYVVLRGSDGALALRLDADPAWTGRGGAAPRLDADALRAEAALAPAGPEVLAVVAPARSVRLLPLIVGAQAFAVPVEAVERVLAAAARVRLPSEAGRPQRWAVAVDGRVVPVRDARQWMGLAPGATPPAVHVLLRAQGALAVDGVGRTVAVDAAAVRPVQDPARRLRAIAEAPGGTWPVLDVSGLAQAAQAGDVMAGAA